MVLKQQSNSLQEGPRNPFTANGTGWSKGGCTHDLEEKRKALLPSCTLAPRLPGLAFQAQVLPIPAGHLRPPPVPTWQPATITLLGWGRTSAHHNLLCARPKTRAAASLAPTAGLALWQVLFLSLGQMRVARSTLE